MLDRVRKVPKLVSRTASSSSSYLGKLFSDFYNLLAQFYYVQRIQLPLCLLLVHTLLTYTFLNKENK